MMLKRDAVNTTWGILLPVKARKDDLNRSRTALAGYPQALGISGCVSLLVDAMISRANYCLVDAFKT